MSMDDRYRAKLQAAIASLCYWIPSISDVATVSESDGGDYWRLGVEPRVPGGCPFEMVIRSDHLHDVIIDGESYEDQPSDDLEFFLALAKGIARGDVIRRHHCSRASGREVAVETIVSLGGDSTWSRRRELAPSDKHGAWDEDEEIVLVDHRYLPFRR